VESRLKALPSSLRPPLISFRMFGIERKRLAAGDCVRRSCSLNLPTSELYMLSWIALAPLLVAVLRARVPDTLQLRGEEHLLPARPGKDLFWLHLRNPLVWRQLLLDLYTMKQLWRHRCARGIRTALPLLLYLALYHGAFGLIVSLLAKQSLRYSLVFSPLCG